jgi:putative SOS response-associated peptidase YedK
VEDKKTGRADQELHHHHVPGQCITQRFTIACPSFSPKDWAKWLGEVPATNDQPKALLVPFNDDALTMWPVNRQKVGNVRNKDREVAEPEALSRS